MTHDIIGGFENFLKDACDVLRRGDTPQHKNMVFCIEQLIDTLHIGTKDARSIIGHWFPSIRYMDESAEANTGEWCIKFIESAKNYLHDPTDRVMEELTYFRYGGQQRG